MDAFMGTIMAVGFNFAPNGWAFCNGQTMSISQNSALFALLGTTYGGDGVNTFGLPDLRGRVAVGGQGNGPGLTPIAQGQISGTNAVTVLASGTTLINLTAANLPAHTHPATLSTSGLIATTTVNVGTGTNGSGTAVATNGGLTSTGGGGGSAAIYLPAGTAPTAPVTLGGVTTAITGTGTVTVDANTGGGTALNAPVSTTAQASIMQPYLGLNYIIALTGIFPSRS
jgi:microcystin-dependent protein